MVTSSFRVVVGKADIEELTLKTPPQFEINYQEKGKSISVSEMIPQGETIDNWTQMISHQVFHQQADTNPNDFMNDILRMFEPV